MAKPRMAGALWKWLTKGATKEELAFRLGMDAAVGGMVALQQPGDLGDKVIAGLTDATLSSLGGLTVGKLGGKSPLARSMFDMGGSMAGGYASVPVSESILRVKGGGTSPYDKLQMEQYAQMRKEIEQDVLNQIMAGRRVPVIGDPFLKENGLG